MSGLAVSQTGPHSLCRARGMLRRAGLHAIRIEIIIFEKFCGEKSFFASEITRDRAKIRVAYPMCGLAASQKGPRSLFRAAICCGVRVCMRFGKRFGPTFPKIFPATKFFASEITRDHAEIRVAYRCPALPRAKQVPEASLEPRYAAACGFACDVDCDSADSDRH